MRRRSLLVTTARLPRPAFKTTSNCFGTLKKSRWMCWVPSQPLRHRHEHLFFCQMYRRPVKYNEPEKPENKPMKTDQHPDPAAVFPQILTNAVSKLKNRLQRQYEQTYPELGDLVRIVLDEEEAKAWELSFQHLFLPDLVEAHIAQLNLQPADTRHESVLVPHNFAKIDNYQPAFSLCG